MSTNVPNPRIVLFGCRPHVPHVEGDPCPVCKRLIGLARRSDRAAPFVLSELDQYIYCARCDGVSPANESRCAAQRIGVRGRTRAELAEDHARRRLQRRYDRAKRRAELDGGPILSERERRRVWNGYKGGIAAELAGDLPNRAKVGRDWLRAIGQLPDWSKPLGRLEAGDVETRVA